MSGVLSHVRKFWSPFSSRKMKTVTAMIYLDILQLYLLPQLEDHQPNTMFQQTRVEAGSNTSTVTLRVVRGDEMGLKKCRAIA
jgi:hypothetical protein